MIQENNTSKTKFEIKCDCKQNFLYIYFFTTMKFLKTLLLLKISIQIYSNFFKQLNLILNLFLGVHFFLTLPRKGLMPVHTVKHAHTSGGPNVNKFTSLNISYAELYLFPVYLC